MQGVLVFSRKSHSGERAFNCAGDAGVQEFGSDAATELITCPVFVQRRAEAFAGRRRDAGGAGSDPGHLQFLFGRVHRRPPPSPILRWETSMAGSDNDARYHEDIAGKVERLRLFAEKGDRHHRTEHRHEMQERRSAIRADQRDAAIEEQISEG